MLDLDDVIKAFECFNTPHEHGYCFTCIYGYEYHDESGDGPGVWRCDEEKLENDMYSWLKIYQHLIEDK